MARSKKNHGIKRSKRATFDAQDGRCHYCHCEMNLEDRLGSQALSREATWDHIIPAVAGGNSSHENTVLACGDCNSRKANIPYDIFVRAEGWLLDAERINLLRVQVSAARSGKSDILYHMARYCPTCDLVMKFPTR